MHQYLDLCRKVLNEGEWVYNKRTGKKCLTLINADFEYDLSKGEFPLVTTRKAFYKSAIAELLGYLRGYDNAADFRELGTKTWDSNANETQAWLANPVRKGTDDMGRVYGVQGRSWAKPDGGHVDQLKKVFTNLSNGIDDRGEIVTFYNPGEFHLGCLRPCMHTHNFSLLGDKIYLTSYQRSVDLPLGLVFNMPQVAVLAYLGAIISGKQPAKAFHKMVNIHIYEDQIEGIKTQLERDPFPMPTLKINPDIKSLEDIETWVTPNDFEVVGYEHHPSISFPFSA
ncbi:thymidylate synthase [Hirschia maritima]|uniref:thymidylate synthase n=1 Tax=Hirschia maritima TaxID=1121961 RepID=UPI0003741573|nr:thymidylate synthase [Hirschia maritima]